MIEPRPDSVVVASFRSLAEANITRSALAESGVTTLPSDPHTIVVSAEDGERALSIVERVWPDEPAALTAGESERCPECGSDVLLRIRRLPFFIVFTTLMIVIGHAVGQINLFALVAAIVAFILAIGPNRRCIVCGAQWQGRTPPAADVPVEPPEVLCPICGSDETGLIDRRRMKATTMLVNFIAPPLFFVWPFMARRKCDECGHEWR